MKVDGVGNEITNNLLYSAPHHALEPNGNDMVLKGNVLHHFSCDAFDNGGVYWAPDDWTDWNYTISHNVLFLGVHKKVGCNEETSCTRAGVYPDDGSVGGVIESNTFWLPKPKYPGSSVNKHFIDVNQWGNMINGGRNWNVTNNVIVDLPAVYQTGAGITWNVDMQDQTSDYYGQMKAEKWNKGIYAQKYPELAALEDKFGSLKKCAETKACPAAPFANYYSYNVGVNNTPTPQVSFNIIFLHVII